MKRTFGLVLAGGRSTRMGRDKSLIDYHGVPQIDWVRALLAGVCQGVFLSRAFDATETSPDVLRDLAPDLGPIGGLLAAHAFAPHAAWLVVACDMPGVSESSLRRLLAARASEFDAVCYADEADRLEPLLALYKPTFLAALVVAANSGERSLSRALANLGGRLGRIHPEHVSETSNVNTPEELRDFLCRRELRHVEPAARPLRRL